MAKTIKEEKLVYLKTGLILGIVLVVFLSWLWWARVYTSKSNVFYGMLSNSLSTFGVSKSVSQDSVQGKMTQISQAQFGANNIVKGKTVISQPTPQGDVNVVTASIANPNDEYVSYSAIDMPAQEDKPKVDFSKLLNQWGKTTKLEGGGSTFSQTVFGIVPFGNLPANLRGQLLNIMHSKNVYKTDFAKTQVKSENGRVVYVYEVEINVQGYAELLKSYDAMLGLQQMEQLNPDEYVGTDPIKVQLTVDKLSRNLVKITQGEGQQSEVLGGQGIHNPVDVPENAISRQELESKLQNLLGGHQ